MFEIIFFNLIALIVFCAIMTVSCKNPVHSILYLIMVFVGSTIVLLTLKVEFIAMLFLIVYVGAISVLFLFVVMMLNVKIVEINERLIWYLPIGGFLGLILFVELFLVIQNCFLSNSTIFQLESDVFQYNFFEINNLKNVQIIGNLLYNDYVYGFILASLILLVAMIGSIVLTLNQKHESKYQNVYVQTTMSIRNAMRLVC